MSIHFTNNIHWKILRYTSPTISFMKIFPIHFSIDILCENPADTHHIHLDMAKKDRYLGQPILSEIVSSISDQHPVTLPLSQVACSFPSGTEVTVGTRCLALYEDGFYPGVVGEVPTAANRWRYLVFYDDGYASYADLGSLRQVCKSYKHVWVGVAPGNRDFIERYLKEYPWRKMVKLKVGDKIITELLRLLK